MNRNQFEQKGNMLGHFERILEATKQHLGMQMADEQSLEKQKVEERSEGDAHLE